ncbi:MAG TPA: hypothetical protein VHZ31_04780 [Solirubrobacteraceae bacterium]|nr:hypothetical protein [Solirubrobacteraceae bacterium]
MSRVRRITAAVSAAALVGAGGIGVAQAASQTSGSTKASHSAGPGDRHGGGPTMSSANLAAIAKALGVTTAQLKAAQDAAKPAQGTGGKPASMASTLAMALGVDAAKVQAILDANRPAMPAAGAKPAAGTKPAGGRPAKPDDAKLISALATGLNLDEATVKAAFDKIDAARKTADAARQTAMYAAIATSLGLSSDAVQAAFAANRPARHGPPPAAA